MCDFLLCLLCFCSICQVEVSKLNGRERNDDYADKTMVYYKLSLCYAMHGVYGKREKKKIYQGNYDTENRRTKKEKEKPAVNP